MGKGGSLLPPMGDRPKPKSLIEAVSDIQMYATQELDGQSVPDNYLLWRELLGFMEVGIKGGLISTLISGLMLPFSIAVVQQLFPIFGTFEPTLFDQLFAVVLGVSFQLGYNMLTAVNLSTCYIGIWCKKAIRAIYGGLLLSKSVVVFGLFILYHWLYFAITPERLAEFHTRVKDLYTILMIPTGVARHIEYWLLEVRHVLLVSAWMVLALTVFTAVISLTIFAYGAHRAGQSQMRRKLYLED
jgi:hypothetical protein